MKKARFWSENRGHLEGSPLYVFRFSENTLSPRKPVDSYVDASQEGGIGTCWVMGGSTGAVPSIPRNVEGNPARPINNTGCIDNLGHLSAKWIAQECDKPALHHPMLADRWITVMIRRIHIRAQEKLGHIW